MRRNTSKCRLGFFSSYLLKFFLLAFVPAPTAAAELASSASRDDHAELAVWATIGCASPRLEGSAGLLIAGQGAQQFDKLNGSVGTSWLSRLSDWPEFPSLSFEPLSDEEREQFALILSVLAKSEASSAASLAASPAASPAASHADSQRSSKAGGGNASPPAVTSWLMLMFGFVAVSAAMRGRA